MTKGYYIVSVYIDNDIGLFYGQAGGDPGLSYKEALDFTSKNPGFKIIDSNGKEVFGFYSAKT